MVAEARSGRKQTSAEVADQIRALGALRDDGALTDEEFQAKKAQLLEHF
jgi:hypothetical protein